MTDSGNSPLNWLTVPNNQKKNKAPYLTFVEEIESPSILSDLEQDPSFVAAPTAHPLAKESNPNLFAIHNQQQQQQQTPFPAVVPSSNNNDAPIDENVQSANALSKKRKAEQTSPSEIQGLLKSPGLSKTKSKTILFPAELERGVLYEKENVNIGPTKNSKRPKLNRFSSPALEEVQNEHEVPSTPPPVFNDDQPQNLKDEILTWKTEMMHTTNINKQLTLELQAQLNLLGSLVPKFQKNLVNGISRETAETLVVKTFEKINHKLEEKYEEFEKALNNLDQSMPELMKNSDRINNEANIEQTRNNSNNNDSKSNRHTTLPTPQESGGQANEEELEELQDRISSLERELSDSRQFITLLGNKVLEMEAKVFQGKLSFN